MGESSPAKKYRYFLKGTETEITTEMFLEQMKKKINFSPESIVLNWPELDRETDIHETDVWVWTGFVKPGKHDLVVRAENGGFYRRNLGIGVRAAEFDLFEPYSVNYAEINQQCLGQREFAQRNAKGGKALFRKALIRSQSTIAAENRPLNFLFKDWNRDTEQIELRAFILD